MTKEQKLIALEKLYATYKNHDKCHLGFTDRTNIVFGEGNPNTKLILIGEAPGAKENKLGRPFVGRSGKLLDKVLAACRISRNDIYITNIVKCRPPKNRRPTSAETSLCKNLFLLHQIKIIKPKVICTLGSCATEGLIKKQIKITKERGIPTTYNQITVIPTYHPAYILRNPKQFEFLIADIRKAIDLSI